MDEIKIHCRHDELMDIAELLKRQKPDNRNKHPRGQILRLAEIYRYNGVRQPIVISNLSNQIVKGHGRLLAAIECKMQHFPVEYQDYTTEDQEYADAVADNAIALWAELDLAGINADIPKLHLPSIDLLGIEGFELEPADKYADQDADDVPEVKESICKPGDLWLLGNHRLLCGDATSKDDVERLMNGEKADMVYTDPPYGVDYDGGTTKRIKLANDDHDGMYSVACDMGFEFSKNNAPLYMWHAGTMSAAAAAAAAAAGWTIRSHIIWNKNMAQFGALSAQYKQKHEPAFYCFKRGQTVNWCGPTNEVTVWDCARASVNEFHPTQKPVELAERAIKNHKAEFILDLFLGSGSTLIACEKTNRKCFGMEIDPQYCDVIVARWEKFTGQKAQLAENTKTEIN